MGDKTDFRTLFLQAYLIFLKRLEDPIPAPEYRVTKQFLAEHECAFREAAEVKLPYGECPICGESCQPEYMPDKDGLEYNECDDCKITWVIVHTEETKDAQSWESVWLVQDIELF